MRSQLDMAVDHIGRVAVAHPVGTLDVHTYPHLRDALFKCVAEQPDALLVDVADLQVPAVHALSVFALVALRSAEWPGLPVALVSDHGPQRRLLALSPVRRFVTMYSSVADATAAIGHQPGRRRAVLELPADAVNSGRARRFAHRTCLHWAVPAVAAEAAMIVNELVENTAKHTVSGAYVRLDLRGSLFSIAVTDTDPRPAVLRERLSGGVSPSGLLLVAGTAKAWGCMPTISGGKTVWATLRLPTDIHWR